MHSRQAHSRYTLATALPRTAPTLHRCSVLIAWRAASALTSRNTTEHTTQACLKHLDMSPTQLQHRMPILCNKTSDFMLVLLCESTCL